MRLGVVDLIFSWPPNGGADVDLFHVMEGLVRRGVDIYLFVLRDPRRWERGCVDAASLPFPVTVIEADLARAARGDICRQFRAAVDAWKPDVLLIGHGFQLKPYVMLGLTGYPMAVRAYAHELTCHRGVQRFKDGATCPRQYLTDPHFCRACAFEFLGPRIRRGIREAWLDEYLVAEAYQPGYHSVFAQAMRGARLAVVSNQATAKDLAPHCPEVRVLPGGVDAEAFAFRPLPENARKVILMTGRGEDPAKGAQVLIDAGERLWATRQDFEIQITMPEDTPSTPWFRPIGWKSHGELPELNAAADICVAPSVWEEPFGLVALEAMAVGRSVCGSRVGGLQEIVRHDKTGLLFDAGDAEGLAAQLARLLDDPALRARMGQEGRAVVEEHYLWDGIVERHYLPLLEALRS